MRLITVRSAFIFLLLVSSIAVIGLGSKGSARRHRTTVVEVIPLIAVDGKKYFFFTGSACGNGFINCYESLDGVQVCRSGGIHNERRKRAMENVLKKRF